MGPGQGEEVGGPGWPVAVLLPVAGPVQGCARQPGGELDSNSIPNVGVRCNRDEFVSV